MFVQHLRAGGYTAVIWEWQSAYRQRKKSALSAFCRRAAILHIRQYSIYSVFTLCGLHCFHHWCASIRKLVFTLNAHTNWNRYWPMDQMELAYLLRLHKGAIHAHHKNVFLPAFSCTVHSCYLHTFISFNGIEVLYIQYGMCVCVHVCV